MSEEEDNNNNNMLEKEEDEERSQLINKFCEKNTSDNQNKEKLFSYKIKKLLDRLTDDYDEPLEVEYKRELRKYLHDKKNKNK